MIFKRKQNAPSKTPRKTKEKEPAAPVASAPKSPDSAPASTALATVPPEPTNAAGNKRGMHLTPEKAKEIRANRVFYSRREPVLQCNRCEHYNSCPQFRAGYECAFLAVLGQHKIETIDDITKAMKALAEAGMQRAHRAMLFETLSGGHPTEENTIAIDSAYQKLQSLADLNKEQGLETLSISAPKGIIGELLKSVLGQGDSKDVNRIIDVSTHNKQPALPVIMGNSEVASFEEEKVIEPAMP